MPHVTNPQTNTYTLEQAEDDIATIRGHATTSEEVDKFIDVTDTPDTPAEGVHTHSVSGQFKYVSTDTNAYSTGRLTLTGPASSQNITSTTPVTVTGLSAPVAAGTYRLDVTLLCKQGGASFAVAVRVTGPTATTVSGWTRMTGAATGVTTNLYVHTSLPSTVTGPAFSASIDFVTEISLFLVFSASGTLAVQAAQGSSGHNWSVQPNSYLELLPVT